VLINQTEVYGLIDSGASKSLIAEQLACELELEIKPLTHGDLTVMFSADGNPLPIMGKTCINFDIAGLKIVCDVNVVKQLNHALILGCDILKSTGAVIDLGGQTVTFRDDADSIFQTALYCVDTAARPAYARAACNVSIQPFTEAIVKVDVPQSCNGRTVLLEQIANVSAPRFATARSLSKCQNGKTYCHIFNYQPKTVTLFKGHKLARIENMANVCSCSPADEGEQCVLRETETVKYQPREVLNQFCTEFKFKINPELTSEQRYQLLQLLFENKDVFARSLHEVTTYPGYQLSIELKSNRRMYRRQFKLSPEDSFEAQRQIALMSESNIIERTDNVDFNSPIFLVNKRSGQRRMVFDLRVLNSNLVGKALQLPKINDLLNEVTLSRPRYISTLDLFSGYYAIEIEPSSRNYLTFTAPITGERWRYVRCPFGLSSAPMAMCLIINNVFRGQLRRRVYTYLDDIMTGERNFPDHLRDLENIFYQLRSNRLKCNPAKCEFAQSKVIFLGFSISS